jgi:hypothetical protein
MKEFLYILFCVVILGLGIILLNSKGANELFLTDYPVYVSPGVDFSKMNHIKSTYSPPKTTQTTTRGLIGNDLSKKAVAKGNAVYPSQSGNAGHVSTSLYSGGFFDSRVSRANNSVPGQGVNGMPSLPLIRSGEGSATSGNQNGSGLIAGGGPAASGNAFRAFVPLNPVNDYREGDITHPGGNPGQDDQLVSVPVGDGLLPLFLMGVLYILFVLIIERFRKEKHIL